MIGVLNGFSPEQFSGLKKLVLALCKKYKLDQRQVIGHCETKSGKEQGKTCPDFQVASLRIWLSGRI